MSATGETRVDRRRNPTDGASDAVVRIENLTIQFSTDNGPVEAVKGVSLSVNSGEILAIVGESGSGKSVTARSMICLMPETATLGGAVYLDGTDVLQAGPAKLRELRGTSAAMVFQEPS